MPLIALVCPQCGGPLPADALGGVLVCTYCKHTLVRGPGAVLAAAFLKARADLRGAACARGDRSVVVADEPYRVIGRLGVGASSDVFLAERARAPVERVVLKVLRCLGDEDLLRREFEQLTELTSSDAKGSPHFSQLVPQPVAMGVVEGAGVPRRPAALYRYVSGFAHTVDDARAAYPGGVDPRAAVWMWRRLLEVLGWAHQGGFVHGAVLPQHVVLHARDHGVRLVGWSSSSSHRRGASPARPAAPAAFYEDLLGERDAPAPSTDLAMSARVVAFALGANDVVGASDVPSSVPAPLSEIVRREARAPGGGAWALRDAVGRAAEVAFGPPRYHPFVLPGWV